MSEELTNTEQHILQVLSRRLSMSPTDIAVAGLLEPHEVATSIADLLARGLLRLGRRGLLLVEPIYTLTNSGQSLAEALPEWKVDYMEMWRWGRILATRGIETYLTVGALVGAAGIVILKLEFSHGLGVSLIIIGILTCLLGVAAKS